MAIANERWLTAEVRYWGEPWTRVLLLESDSAQWCDGEIQWCHKITTKGWVTNVVSPRPADWQLVSTGDEASLSDPFYRILHHGCCDEAPASEYFSLRTGARVYRSSIDLAHVTISGAPVDRYVAFLDTWSSFGPDEISQVHNIVGLLQYGPPDGPVQTAAVVSTVGTPPFHYRVVSLKLVDAAGRVTDFLVLGPPGAKPSPSVMSGYSVQLKLLPDYDKPLLTVIVPVTGDRIDAAHARAARGLAVVAP